MRGARLRTMARDCVHFFKGEFFMRLSFIGILFVATLLVLGAVALVVAIFSSKKK